MIRIILASFQFGVNFASFIQERLAHSRII